jgi:hypothetical protein
MNIYAGRLGRVPSGTSNPPQVPPIREEFVEVAPESWNEPDETDVTIRFMI